MRTAARAYRIVGGEPRRSDRSCETRRGEKTRRSEVQHGPGQGAPSPGGARPPVGEIWRQQESRGLTARELIRLAQAVRLRPANG